MLEDAAVLFELGDFLVQLFGLGHHAITGLREGIFKAAQFAMQLMLITGHAIKLVALLLALLMQAAQLVQLALHGGFFLT